MHLLVLGETSPTIQKVVQMTFPEPEFRVAVFEDGLALLDALGGLRPDAVLLDVDLPGADGCEVGRWLKSRPELRRAALVFLKGTFAALDPERLAGIDHRGVVQKPFDSEKLGAFVRDLIEREAAPVTLPEEPAFQAPPRPVPAAVAAGGRAARPARPVTPRIPPELLSDMSPEDLELLGIPQVPEAAAPPPAQPGIREELLAAEREIEKRVRARVLAELKDYVDSRLRDGGAGD